MKRLWTGLFSSLVKLQASPLSKSQKLQPSAATSVWALPIWMWIMRAFHSSTYIWRMHMRETPVALTSGSLSLLQIGATAAGISIYCFMKLATHLDSNTHTMHFTQTMQDLTHPTCHWPMMPNIGQSWPIAITSVTTPWENLMIIILHTPLVVLCVVYLEINSTRMDFNPWRQNRR